MEGIKTPYNVTKTLSNHPPTLHETFLFGIKTSLGNYLQTEAWPQLNTISGLCPLMCGSYNVAKIVIIILNPKTCSLWLQNSFKRETNLWENKGV